MLGGIGTPGREVDPVGEVAVAERHPDPHRFEHAATRMLLLRVVPEDAEHADVGLGSDAGADRDGRAGPPPFRELVEERGRRGLERGAPIELGDRIVERVVDDDLTAAKAGRPLALEGLDAGESRHWLPGTGDHDLLARFDPLKESGQMRLRLVHVDDDLGHRVMLT